MGDAGDGRARGLDRPVASTEPTRISTNPATIGSVSGSPRNATPSATATAGLTYVMTVARTGPTSSIRAKKTRNATAVHTTASTRTAASTVGAGHRPGNCARPTGRYSTVVTARETATTPSPGRQDRLRARMNGPSAYPITTAAIWAKAIAFPPPTSPPTSAATPPSP